MVFTLRIWTLQVDLVSLLTRQQKRSRFNLMSGIATGISMNPVSLPKHLPWTDVLTVWKICIWYPYLNNIKETLYNTRLTALKVWHMHRLAGHLPVKKVLIRKSLQLRPKNKVDKSANKQIMFPAPQIPLLRLLEWGLVATVICMISVYFLDNTVMITPKRRVLLFTFTILCLKHSW